MTTDEYERDFTEQGALKRPGRLDFRTLNNIDDAGDGHPGVQKAIRNWVLDNSLSYGKNIYWASTEAELNAVITEIGDEPGFIFLSKGSFTLTSTINIGGSGSYVIQGQGDKTIINVGGNWSVFNITSAESCVLRDFKINVSDFTATSTNCIKIAEGSDNKILIDNITIIGDGTNGYGIHISSDSSVFRNCRINGLDTGIYLTDVNKNMIYGNNIQSCNAYGIRCVSPITTSNYNIIVDNLVYDCSVNIIVDASGGGSTSYNTIKDNISYGGDYGIYLDSTDFNIVNGNNCYNNVNYGIYNDDSEHTTVNGNMCIDNDIGGIILTGVTQYCSLSANLCKSSTLGSVGLIIESTGNNSIGGNNCSQNANGMGIKIINSSYNTIVGNLCNENDGDFVGTTAGIYVSGNSDFNTIAGNMCSNNNNVNVGGDGYGIYIVDATCDDNHLGGNNCEGNDVEYLDSGTGTVDDSGDQVSYDLNRFG